MERRTRTTSPRASSRRRSQRASRSKMKTRRRSSAARRRRRSCSRPPTRARTGLSTSSAPHAHARPLAVACAMRTACAYTFCARELSACVRVRVRVRACREFVALMAVLMKPSVVTPDQKLELVFRMYDKDNSKKLEKAEIEALLDNLLCARSCGPRLRSTDPSGRTHPTIPASPALPGCLLAACLLSLLAGQEL